MRKISELYKERFKLFVSVKFLFWEYSGDLLDTSKTEEFNMFARDLDVEVCIFQELIKFQSIEFITLF